MIQTHPNKDFSIRLKMPSWGQAERMDQFVQLERCGRVVRREKERQFLLSFSESVIELLQRLMSVLFRFPSHLLVGLWMEKANFGHKFVSAAYSVLKLLHSLPCQRRSKGQESGGKNGEGIEHCTRIYSIHI